MDIIELIKSILYGIVEGITEWLPISSTGHMILLEEIMPMKVSEHFWEMFLVVVQLGAILAVVLLYWKKLFPFNFKNKNRPFLRYDIFVLWFKILVACIPAAVVGLLFDDWLNEHLYNSIVVAIMLILVGIAFILLESRNRYQTFACYCIIANNISGCFDHWFLSVNSCYFSRYFSFGSNYFRRFNDRYQQNSCSRIYFLFGNSGHVWRKFIELVKFGFAFSTMEFLILLIGMLTAFIVSVIVIRFS